MTTSPTYAREEWIPLGIEGRGWELSSARDASSQQTPHRAVWPTEKTHPAPADDDFAAEAEYSRPLGSRVPGSAGGPREDAPVIREQHVWGVAEEWGEKAGQCGQGAKAFELKREAKKKQP
jgi:protein AFG1